MFGKFWFTEFIIFETRGNSNLFQIQLLLSIHRKYVDVFRRLSIYNLQRW